MKKVLVVYGGISDEKEISLLSAKSILENISKKEFSAKKIDLIDLDIDKISNDEIVFIAVHGEGGEDGNLQNEFETKGIKFTGSGSEATRKCWDKNLSKKIMVDNDIRTPNFIFLDSQHTEIDNDFISSSKNYFVKPTTNGSSLGISKVSNLKELQDAIYIAKKFSPAVIVEEAFDINEYTVAILDGKALSPLEIKVDVPSGYYDFEAKYVSKNTQKLPILNQKLIDELKQLGLSAYRAHGCSGWARVDIVFNGEDHAVIEINTVPGFTRKSLFPFAAFHDGISYQDLISRIIKSV